MALRKPRPSVATLHRRIVSVARQQGWSPPSYSSVHSIVAALDPALVTLAHEGHAAFRNRFELVYRHRAERPNAIWQADHTEFDILILDSNGAPVRPWLTTVIDDHSRAVAGYMVFLGAPSSLQTSLALRQAIWRKPDPQWPVSGIPDALYVDHGSDFTSTHLDQVAADLHFQLVYSAVDRPQGRGKVERLFGTLNTELLPELPGHLRGGKPATPPKLSLSDLDAAVGAFIVGTYNTRVHSETGTTPLRAWVARRYAHWDLAEPLLLSWGPRDPSDTKVYSALARTRTVFYTPTVSGPLSEFRKEVKLLSSRASICIDETTRCAEGARSGRDAASIELLIIDEAERLSTSALEYARDLFDRTNIGLILVGMPGIEKRMARYPQLFSRVGFAHHYRPLLGDELSFVLTRHWRQLGLTMDEADFTHSRAIAAIARITGGNFRLLHRLFVQIERILRINDLTVITEDVVEAARSTLVIGVT